MLFFILMGGKSEKLFSFTILFRHILRNSFLDLYFTHTYMLFFVA